MEALGRSAGFPAAGPLDLEVTAAARAADSEPVLR